MAACRGHRETPTETAICPKCRVEMDRPENHLRWTAYNTKAGADRAHWESEK